MTVSLIQAILQADVYPSAVVTPLHAMKAVSTRLGRTVLQKREDLQRGRSFKIRGAAAKVATLSDRDLGRGVICASAGNHAQGVAWACRSRDVAPTVFMPIGTPAVKLAAVRALGARVVIEGADFDEACAAAVDFHASRGGALIHPFDDLAVIAGQGTVAVELLRQPPAPVEAVFVPIGGGGLAAGVGAVLRILKPGTRVIGVEAVGAPTMHAAFKAGRPVDLPTVDRFADGTAVRRAGHNTFELCRRFLDDIILVDRTQICEAIRATRIDLGVTPEPAGALALAGLLVWAKRNPGHTPLAAILSGANIDAVLETRILGRRVR